MDILGALGSGGMGVSEGFSILLLLVYGFNKNGPVLLSSLLSVVVLLPADVGSHTVLCMTALIMLCRYISDGNPAMETAWRNFRFEIIS